MAKKNFALFILFLIVFMMFTVSVKNLDVKPIGPENSEVGFSVLNGTVNEMFGESNKWDKITDVFKYISILCMGFFACLGVYQLIKGKSIKSVDADIICLGLIYVIMLVFEVIFDKAAINFRPLLEDGELAASYPSSHTVLIITVIATAMIEYHYRINRKPVILTLDIICIIIIALGVIGRILSGQHWLTDIIGGMLLGISYIFLFYAFAYKPLNKKVDFDE